MTTQEFEHTATGLRPKLLSIARRFTKASGLQAEAEDLVQEALTELWKLCSTGYEVRDMEALAVKITKTVCVKHYRKRTPVTTDIDGIDFPDSHGASERIDTEEALQLRQKLFAGLSDTQRQYLELRNEQGLTLDEIAAETGHPKASVKATISQARKLMNEMLKKI
ncbi:MAG: sigma-70 family RNA polymerase sigma factor [Alistipes sp.]|nr:sigma-70 family RNA polymerase sigma factor [Alistipes sp.]